MMLPDKVLIARSSIEKEMRGRFGFCYAAYVNFEKKCIARVISIFTIFAIFGCSQPIAETETLLVCEGDAESIIAGLGGKDRQTFTITKLGDKVIKVKSEHMTYGLEKIDVSTPQNKGPIFVQLVAEGDKLVLRSEITEDKTNRDTVLYNTGKYEQDRGLFGWAKGQCSVEKKAF